MPEARRSSLAIPARGFEEVEKEEDQLPISTEHVHGTSTGQATVDGGAAGM
jgi:hypothetical protein